MRFQGERSHGCIMWCCLERGFFRLEGGAVLYSWKVGENDSWHDESSSLTIAPSHRLREKIVHFFQYVV